MLSKEEFEQIISIKDMHKRRTALLKLGFFEADKDKRTKHGNIPAILKNQVSETDNVWGAKNEYCLSAALSNYDGYEWLWIEYLVHKKQMGCLFPEKIWIFARELN